MSAHVTPITLYWRPGCGFCGALRRRLDTVGLVYEARNIWEDRDAAEFVRSVTGGNETVPTVRVGDMALVNPSGDEVLGHVAEVAPDQVPEDYEPAPEGRVVRAVNRMLGGL